MKKIFSFLAIAAICVGFAACDDVEEGGAGPQVNPQEPVMEQNGIAVENYDATTNAVSLADYQSEENGGLVPMLKVTKLENFPESYTLGGNMYLANNPEMKDAIAIPLQYVDGLLKVKVEDWETAHLALYSKNPKAVESYVNFELTASNNGSVIRLGELRYAYHKVNVTPLPAKNPVEDKYYLICDGTEYEMTPTNEEDVYDPPTFSKAVEVPEGGTTIIIRSLSGKKYGQGDAENALALDGAAIELKEVGPHLVTVNMEELTYKVTLAVPALYGGSANNALTTFDYVNYQGIIGMRGTSFNLANAVTAPSLFWGQGEEEGTLAMATSLNDIVKITVDVKGCYWVTANINKLTYTTTLCEWGIIGAATGDESWSTDVKMTATDKNFLIWEAKDVELINGKEFKIRANGEWTIDFGCANQGGTQFDDVCYKGSNFTWDQETGKYDIKLDFSKVPYTITYTKK